MRFDARTVDKHLDATRLGPLPGEGVTCEQSNQVAIASQVCLHLDLYAIKHDWIATQSSRARFNARCKLGNKLITLSNNCV